MDTKDQKKGMLSMNLDATVKFLYESVDKSAAVADHLKTLGYYEMSAEDSKRAEEIRALVDKARKSENYSGKLEEAMHLANGLAYNLSFILDHFKLLF